MYELILLVFALFLSSVGVSALLSCLWLMCFKTKSIAKGRVFVLLNGENDKETFNFYFEKFKWYGKSFCDDLIFVCQEKCKDFLYIEKNYENIHFCKKDEVLKFFKD